MASTLATALLLLPDSLRATVSQGINHANFDGIIAASAVQAITEQSALSQLLPFAAAFADPPVSRFHVGALVIGASGQGYIGANIELKNAPLSQSLHAEQAAISLAWQQGETQLSALYVSAPPCGHCRQFIAECFESDQLAIHVAGQQSTTLSALLPQAFTPKALGNEHALLQPQQYQSPECSDNKWAQAVQRQACLSYAPYSGFYHALGAVFGNEIVIGRYAENAAYNPSLQPLQALLWQLRCRQLSLQHAEQVILVNRGERAIDAKSILTPLLAELTSAPLSHYIMK